jgi:hypothetical protein
MNEPPPTLSDLPIDLDSELNVGEEGEKLSQRTSTPNERGRKGNKG